MPENEILERRLFIRKIINNTRFRNLTDIQLDCCLLYIAPDGFTFQDPKGYNYFIPRSGAYETLANERIERAMIPKEYAKLYSNTFDWTVYGENTSQQSIMIAKFICDYKEFAIEGMGLYIYSQTKGSGKTMLSCIILNEISSKYGINTKFINVMDYLNITKKSYRGNDEDISMIRKASLLVVDDIGTQISKEWIDSTFYELVNYRYNNKLPTIFTSNTPAEALKMDDRIIDRIERKTLVVKIPEKSIRRIKGSSEKNEFMTRVGLSNRQKAQQVPPTLEGQV